MGILLNSDIFKSKASTQYAQPAIESRSKLVCHWSLVRKRVERIGLSTLVNLKGMWNVMFWEFIKWKSNGKFLVRNCIISSMIKNVKKIKYMKNINSWKQKKMSIVFYQIKKNKQTLLTKISNLYTTREFSNSNILKYNMKSRFVCKKNLMKSAHKEKVDTPIWKPVSTSIFSELQVYIFNSYLITSELCVIKLKLQDINSRFQWDVTIMSFYFAVLT